MPDAHPFPGADWEYRGPASQGFSDDAGAAIGSWFERNAGDRNYCALVVRHGYIVGFWLRRTSLKSPVRMASAAKSLYAGVLGIAVREGKIGSVDDLVADYYPEMMEVGEREGPKPGRYAFGKEKDITFRHLISNTSGYMKPDEQPGTVFHYQTYGMNVLTHALAKAYGYYNADDPTGSPGCGRLIEEKIRDRIGGTWTYSYTHFDLWDQAKLGVYGYYTQLSASAFDMARMGYLWLRGGTWAGQSVIPSAWHVEETQVPQMILDHCPDSEWRYGLGFWTNQYGKLWPHLPTDSYAASGAGSIHIWVCPSLDLVVVQSPGIWSDQAENDTGLLRLVVGVCD